MAPDLVRGQNRTGFRRCSSWPRLCHSVSPCREIVDWIHFQGFKDAEYDQDRFRHASQVPNQRWRVHLINGERHVSTSTWYQRDSWQQLPSLDGCWKTSSICPQHRNWRSNLDVGNLWSPKTRRLPRLLLPTRGRRNGPRNWPDLCCRWLLQLSRGYF